MVALLIKLWHFPAALLCLGAVLPGLHPEIWSQAATTCGAGVVIVWALSRWPWPAFAWWAAWGWALFLIGQHAAGPGPSTLAQKFEEVVLLMLLWPAVAGCRRLAPAVWLILATVVALAGGYSGGVKVAFAASVAAFSGVIACSRFLVRLVSAVAVAVILAVPVAVLASGWIGVDPAPWLAGHPHLAARWDIWTLNMAAMPGHWLTGLGFGGHTGIHWDAEAHQNPHSWPLLMLVDAGIMGLALLAGYVVWAVRCISESAAQAPKIRTASETAFLFASLVFWSQSFSVWWLPCDLPLFVGAGLLLAEGRRQCR